MDNKTIIAVLKSLFDKEYYLNRIGIYKTKIEINFILKHINSSYKTSNLKILDIGGGGGRISKLLIGEGYKDVNLFDKSKEHVLGANKIGINAICSDFHDYESDEVYDIILANEVTQYIPFSDIVSFVKIYLKQGGLFFVVYLNPKSWRQKVKLFLSPQKKKYYSYLTPNQFLSHMQKGGFDLIAEEGYMWQISGSHSNSILVNIFASIEKRFLLNKWIKRSPWIIACYSNK